MAARVSLSSLEILVKAGVSICVNTMEANGVLACIRSGSLVGLVRGWDGEVMCSLRMTQRKCCASGIGER